MAQVNPTPFFTAYSDTTLSSTVNGQLLPIGSIIKAYDTSGVLCGLDTTTITGSFASFIVYGDDPNTAGLDEGAEAGELIRFEINGKTATVDSGDATWTNQALKSVTLSVSQTVAMSAVSLPLPVTALPGDTVQFRVDVRNDGNGTDFYGVKLSLSIPGGPTSFDWEALPPDTAVYADSGQTVAVFFSVKVPTFNADTVNTITYTVFSNVDTTVTVGGTVDLFMTLTDVDDRGIALPEGFSLAQNYPNPFNPTTTITFTLPGHADAQIEIYNILGQQVDRIQLGYLGSGSHQIEYDASALSSGIYFYRLVTAAAVATRKMVLLK